MNSTLAKSTDSSAQSRVTYVQPVANILETKHGFVLEAELPGVSKENLEITVEKGEVTLIGHRSAPPAHGTHLYRESRGSDFRRSFTLDPSIDVAKIAARLENGVLRLDLPKMESVKPRRIELAG